MVKLSMDNLLADFLGLISAVISFALFLPQGKLVWTHRGNVAALKGVSRGTQWMILGNAVSWGIYAVLTGAFWVGAPGLVNGPLAIMTLVLLHRAKNNQPEADGCQLCLREVLHQVFITAPPGWGSIMPCSTLTRGSGVIVTTTEEMALMRGSPS